MVNVAHDFSTMRGHKQALIRHRAEGMEKGAVCFLCPLQTLVIIKGMRIFSLRTLRNFWSIYPESEIPLRAWYKDILKADWKSPAEVKQYRRDVSIVANNRVVFNIKGNHYRLIVEIEYSTGVVFVQFVGTHKAYDKVDAATVVQY